MLENIKSEYFIKMLFSHLNEKIKLNLINYIKRYQKIIDIELYNYRIFSGKYIKFDSKGKGKLL